jgi:hypothetical protein
MNHQNQTRTNDIWGHVRYNLPLFGDLWQTSKASINLQKLTKLEPLTLAWMLTIIQTPPRSNFPLFWSSLPMFTHSLPLPTLEPLSLLWSHILPFGIKSPKSPKQKGLQGNQQVLANIASKRNVKYKGESRMNHDPYVRYQWRYHMYE